jgi:ATP-dependent Clp protease adaptor protein ClpS
MPDMSDTTAKPKLKPKLKIDKPRMHKVLLLNDDFTPREFVVMVLKRVFRTTDDEAYKIMMTAHQKGSCVVAVYTREVAEQKASEANDVGRSAEYPLSFTTEPEE